ncbi:MAG: nucleoside-diphosphate kinase [Syntrophomonadaceae bacterium]|nr:nucleoside-diphosphate kinase [Syntrophomonadaceae bacterium]
MERTFAMVKPDGVQRGLVGEIIGRLERRGIRLAGLKLMQISPSLAAEHYQEHEGQPFFEGLIGFITSGPIAAMVLEGENVVAMVRGMMGATDPQDSAPGTIRGDFGVSIDKNIIHGSDSLLSAAREIGLFFAPAEIIDYSRDLDKWVF